MGANRLRFRLQGTPNNYGPTKQSSFLEADLGRRLSERWSTSAAIGRREQTEGPDYTAWNAGATVALAANVDLDVRWYDTNRHGLDDTFDGRAVAAVTFTYQ
jgi:hypothetical protein